MDGEKERHEKRLSEACAELLKSDDGVYFLRWLIMGNGLFKPLAVADQASMAFMEGRRSVACALFSLVAKTPGGADKFFREDLWTE